MSRPLKPKPPAKGFIDYDTAMALARKGKAVRCAEYMQAGWTIRYIKSAGGFFCINPVTGSNYHFTPQAVDTKSLQWKVVE